MFNKVNFILIFIFFIGLSECIRFRNGRRFGGNLGEPSKKVNFSHTEHSPALWFDQLLDHFDPLNNETWKQVSK